MLFCPPGPSGSVSSCFCESLGHRCPFGFVSSCVFVLLGPREPAWVWLFLLFHVIGPSGFVWVCFFLFLHVFGPLGSVWVCFPLFFRVFGPSGFVWVGFLLVLHVFVGPRGLFHTHTLTIYKMRSWTQERSRSEVYFKIDDNRKLETVILYELRTSTQRKLKLQRIFVGSTCICNYEQKHL